MGKMIDATTKFKAEVKELVGDEYSVLGEYVLSNVRIEMRHNKCGFVYPVRPSNFKNGRRCPKCAGKQRRTHEQFVEELSQKYGDEFEIMVKFEKLSKQIKVLHKTCGKTFEAKPSTLLSSGKCKRCEGGHSMTHQEFVDRVFELSGDEYEVLSEYKGTKEKITLRHKVCGREATKQAGNFLQGHRCRYCNGTALKHHEEFVKEVYEAVGDEYSVLGQYQSAREEIRMRHNKCGWEYDVTPNKFNQGRRCPSCSSSYVTPLNCLATLFPKIAEEWHPTKNGDLTPNDITSKNERMVWWKCKKASCKHEWQTRVSSRTGVNQTKCPKCAGSIASETNCLPIKYPDAMKF